MQMKFVENIQETLYTQNLAILRHLFRYFFAVTKSKLLDLSFQFATTRYHYLRHKLSLYISKHCFCTYEKVETTILSCHSPYLMRHFTCLKSKMAEFRVNQFQINFFTEQLRQTFFSYLKYCEGNQLMYCIIQNYF